MPLIQVDLDRDTFDRLHPQLSQAVHQAQVDALGIPTDDLFQVFYPHEAGELKFDPGYNGVDRRNLLLVRITMVQGYSQQTKRDLFAAIVTRFGEFGIREEDILVSMVENGGGDWYAGRLQG